MPLSICTESKFKELKFNEHLKDKIKKGNRIIGFIKKLS